MKKRQKAGNIPKKNKLVLTSNIFNKVDEVHQFVRLEKCMGKPEFVLCNYQLYENIFENKRVGVCNREIKLTNHECVYCDVVLPKNNGHFSHTYNNN